MGGATLSISLIQFSVDGRGCVPSLLFDLKPNYGGGNGNNGDLLQNVPCRQCPQPFSSSLLTHASAGDSWTLMGKSGSVSCGITASFSWVLMCTRFYLCFQESVSLSCINSCGSMVGLMVTSSKRAYTMSRSAAPRAPAPSAVYLLRRHSNTVLSQSLWGLWVLVLTRLV